MTRLAVVLFNLGGPDTLDAVEPFLLNLFNDPAIIGVPGPVRWLLAKLIAKRRAPIAREIYAQLGGGSPLLAHTRAQAAALEARLKADGIDVRAFVCMRYWHPMSDEVAREVAAWSPERIVLLPLYPQFSTTTTESSFKDWVRAAKGALLAQPTHALCCYPAEVGFVAAQTELAAQCLVEASRAGKPRVLFSAHGLPKRVVARGDPYPRQVEMTAQAIAARLGLASDAWVVCYQSRVGPLEWIGPSTEHEIARAGAEGVPLVVVPIAFVSEHSETLVELDIDYRRRAEAAGVPRYVRANTVGEHPAFIAGLAGLVRAALAGPPGVCRAAEGACVMPLGMPSHDGRSCLREAEVASLRRRQVARCANGRRLDSL